MATTWSISFEHVKRQSRAAADLLRFCAFLAPDDIPEEIITGGAEHLGETLAPVAAVSFLLDQALTALLAYSLIKRDSVKKSISIHRLVQAVLQDGLSSEEQRQWIERVMRAVGKTFPDIEEVKPCERWLPHALLCAIWVDRESIEMLEVVHLFIMAGAALKERILYKEAEPLIKRALMIAEQKLGSEHYDTAGCLNNLAMLYYEQGKYGEAEPLIKRALTISQKELGFQHSLTTTSLNNLALICKEQGKYGEAEPLYKQALEINEQEPEGQPYAILMSLNNLGMLYVTQKKYKNVKYPRK